MMLERPMPSISTVSLDPTLERELEQLAAERQCGSAELAAEAVADYLARERETVAVIKRGLDDMAAGRLVAHDEVITGVRAVITAAEAARRAAT